MQSTPLELLEQYWGHKGFRPLQEEIISSILQGKDTLALLPTGGGKSICFQVPGLVLEGLCLVISPLIALMKDQVENLKQRGISAEAVYSGVNFKEQVSILEKAVQNEIKFLYVSPERLASKEFNGWLRNMPLGLIAIDEAHCISQWGYDFRPEYLRIAEIRKYFSQTPVIALTASATPAVVKDICKYLEFNQTAIFSKSFARNNLSYVVRKIENKALKVLEICSKTRGTGIVYTRNRRKTQQLAEWLQKNGHSADYYHAGLSVEERNKKQNDWIQNKTRIMVCTNAFGMGIDKPDVRFVVHLEAPDCIESYYQEAGRAGRDGKKSVCVLCTHPSDFTREFKKIEEKFPNNEVINHTYQCLCNFLGVGIDSGQGHSYPFQLEEFCKLYELPIIQSYHAIQILHKQGYVYLSENGILSSSMKILVNERETYKLQVKEEKYNQLFLAILRSKGGYFDFYTPIQELQIAKLLNITEKEVIQELRQLHKMEIIEYLEKTSSPQLTLLEPRYYKISPNRHLLDFLKERSLERLTHIQEFSLELKTCRNKYISYYFGEKATENCGTCDNCREMQKPKLDEELFNSFIHLIKENTMEKNLSIQELTDLVSSKNKSDFIQTLEWLLSQELISKNDIGKISWV